MVIKYKTFTLFFAFSGDDQFYASAISCNFNAITKNNGFSEREIQIGASATRQVRFEVKRFSSSGSSSNCCCNGNGSDSDSWWWQCGVVVAVAAVVILIEINQLNQRIGS